VLANLADLADCAYRALVLCMVLGAVKCAFLVAGTAINRRVAGRADLKLRELVKLNLHRVVRITLTLSLRFLCLDRKLALCDKTDKFGREMTYAL